MFFSNNDSQRRLKHEVAHLRKKIEKMSGASYRGGPMSSSIGDHISETYDQLKQTGKQAGEHMSEQAEQLYWHAKENPAKTTVLAVAAGAAAFCLIRHFCKEE